MRRRGMPEGPAENVVLIAAGVTVHDRKTRGHSERVRALSELIAEQLQLAAQLRLRDGAREASRTSSRVRVRWGRIGSQGQSQDKDFATEYDAQRFVSDKLG